MTSRAKRIVVNVVNDPTWRPNKEASLVAYHDVLLRLSITYGLRTLTPTNELRFLLLSIIITATTDWPQKYRNRQMDRNPPITVQKITF